VLTRAQLAVMLVRAKHGVNFSPSAATGAVFLYVSVSDTCADYIEQLFADGITAGCGSGLFCPSSTVTRDQLAVILLRFKFGGSYTPPVASGLFDDVPSSDPAAAWIESLFNQDISEGCDARNYCPSHAVTRDTLAILMARLLAL
jgi:hypothetical protein